MIHPHVTTTTTTTRLPPFRKRSNHSPTPAVFALLPPCSSIPRPCHLPADPYACVTWSEPYPRLLITRDRPRRGGGAADRYYGPFVDAGQLKATVALVRRVLPLRQRRRPLYKNRPCLNYDLGLCPGPCQGLVSEDDYAETVRLAEISLFSCVCNNSLLCFCLPMHCLSRFRGKYFGSLPI